MLDLTDMANGRYILDGREPVLCPDLFEWGDWLQRADRHVARDKLNNGRVSTIFLGLDHQFGDGPPLLFETMIFGGVLAGEQLRYATWEEAEAGHARIAEFARYRAGYSRSHWRKIVREQHGKFWKWRSYGLEA